MSSTNTQIPLVLLLTLIATSLAQTPLTKIVFSSKPAPVSWTKFDTAALTASSPRFINVPNVADEFSSALLTSDFTYVFSAPAKGDHTLRIGAIEKSGCVPDRRVLQYSVNGVSSAQFSVADEVGCEVPYFIDVKFRVRNNRRVTLSFSQVPDKALPTISNIQLFAGSISASVPSPEPVPEDTNTATEIERNVGPSFNVKNSRAVTHSGTISTAGVTGVPANVFKTSRQGSQFSMEFDMPAGTYDVELGFVETTACSAAERVFNVLINGHMRLEAFDIFREAGGCRKALVERFVDQAVDPLMPQPLVIELHAVAGEATLSFVRISPSRKACVPVTDQANILSDHLAHSVPGTYPPGGASSYVDRAGAGSVRVNIDGSSSHTHFAYSGQTGRIISYRWTLVESGKVISNQAKFKRNFPLGTTRLKLTVMDNACSTDEAEATVSVTGNMQPGAYCYYYQGLSELPGPGTLLNAPRPKFGGVSNSVSFGFPKFPFDNTKFVARCIFSVEFTKASDVTEVSVTTKNSGMARVYEGGDLILDSETSTKSAPLVTAVGLSSYEVIYQHTDTSRRPRLIFKINGRLPNKVTHDQSTVMPIVTSIAPSSGRVEGGSRTKISGFGLYRPLKVHFGGQTAMAQRNGATETEVFALSPAVSNPLSVSLTVESSIGLVSNAVQYSYTNECDDVGFEKSQLTDNSGDFIGLTQPTAISVWQDGKLYIGTRVGVIQVVDYNSETLVTKSLCSSEKLTDSRYKTADGELSERTILGITFDPRDKKPRPYVSASTLFWERHTNIDRENKRAWSNGAIERFKPASAATRAKNPKQCLEYDRNIVRNLPVADGDHSVNELVFDQNGDLLIAVGGYTNEGLPYGGLGGNWETYFSGAVVKARLSKGASFNGVIPYTTPENLRTAAPRDGYTDVQIHATGVRNLFSMAMARSGKVYALDMGPNCGFGNASSSCSEYVEADAAKRSTFKFEPFPGQVVVGPPGECRNGDGRPDKLLEIKEGRFYGHSNLQRAALTQNPDECQWIDPETDRVPPPLNSKAPSNYEPALALVKSPKTGIREYGANLFCGRMRGDLILSQMNNRGVWRAKLLHNGGVDGNPFMFFTNGGIRVEENAHGDMLFPKYFNKPTQGVFVMRPKVSVKTGLFAANAVPFRHGRRGGTKLIIGGWGFANGVSVKVGNNNCPVVSASATEITCTVPAFSSGSNSVGVTVSLGGVSSELPKAVLYMDV